MKKLDLSNISKVIFLDDSNSSADACYSFETVYLKVGNRDKNRSKIMWRKRHYTNSDFSCCKFCGVIIDEDTYESIRNEKCPYCDDKEVKITNEELQDKISSYKEDETHGIYYCDTDGCLMNLI